MAALDPETLVFRYACEYRGIPGGEHDPSDFPMDWTVSVSAAGWSGEGSADQDVYVGEAFFRIVPDAGTIDLPGTMGAVDPEMLSVAQMLAHDRPDLLASGMDLGGDLLVLSSLRVEPRYRGHRIGHAILRAILGTVGRNSALVVVEATPLLSDDDPAEGSPEYEKARTALRRYWLAFGFREAAGDYLYLEYP